MSSRLGKLPLLAGLCCAGIAAGALAQSQVTSGAADDTDEVEEVIVTAQRRAERLQEVPIAITVQSGEQLEKAGVANLRDLPAVAPGVRIAGAGANTQPSIRPTAMRLVGLNAAKRAAGSVIHSITVVEYAITPPPPDR